MSNELQAVTPEMYGKIALVIFYNKLIFANRLAVQFKDELAEVGDTVNFYRRTPRKARRLGAGSTLRDVDIKTVPVPVKLDQHYYDSFGLTARELSTSLDTLAGGELKESVEGMAVSFEQALCYCAVTSFLPNAIGGLNRLSGANAKRQALDVNEFFNSFNAEYPRTCGLTSRSETEFLDADFFLAADKLGDGGKAMRTAELGTKVGVNFVRGSLMPSIGVTDVATVEETIDANEYAIGDTVITLSAAVAGLAPGQFVTFEDSAFPYVISSVAGADVTLTSGLRAPLSAGSGASFVGGGEVLNDWVKGWEEEITVDSWTKKPVVGQLITIGSDLYIVMDFDPITNMMLLDRPLDNAIANNDFVGFGPAGDYNPAFIGNSIGVVTRPLARPLDKYVDSAVVNYNGFSMKVTMGYEWGTTKSKVLVDMLMGVKPLNTAYGTVLLG